MKITDLIWMLVGMAAAVVAMGISKVAYWLTMGAMSLCRFAVSCKREDR